MIRLTQAQRHVLIKLWQPSGDGCRWLTGRGALASAKVLRRLGLAEFVKPGQFNGEFWKLTGAGSLELAEMGFSKEGVA